MLKTITPEDMARLETDLIQKFNIPSLLLMEHAASHLCQRICKWMKGRAGEVLFLCGPGNNGGDALAAARLYARLDGSATVWLMPGELKGDALQNYDLLCNTCPMVPVTHLDEALPQIPPHTALIVDGLLGTGLCRPLTGLHLTLVKKVNRLSLPVIAIDIPSGLCGLTGEVMGAAVRACETVTFHRPKQGLFLEKGPDYAGKVRTVDIGLPEDKDDAPGLYMLEKKDVPDYFPPRPRLSHKGDYGRVVILAGSEGMAGAAGLCAQAALRAGAGLVSVMCPKVIFPAVHALAPCATLACYEDTYLIDKADALAVGPGLGQQEELLPLLRLFADSGKPCVWDADGLNLLSRHPELLPMESNHVFTPHPGEARRLLDGDWPDSALDALNLLQGRLGGTVVLKGATTLLTDGHETAINTVGSPGMAKGGSGDALTGILAAYLAKGDYAPLVCAQLACLRHGMAGQAAAKARGENAMTAMDLIDHLT